MNSIFITEKKTHLGNKSSGAFWKETWVGPDQDAVVWPDLCSKQHKNMLFQKEIPSPQFPLTPRKYHAGENASFGVLLLSFGQLGTPALQPESKFNYLAYDFCGLKIFRATWGY